MSDTRIKHGMTGSVEHRRWRSLKCNNTLCDEWREDFRKFYHCVGRCPSKHHRLKRPNTNLPFGPGNAEWVEQRRCTEKGKFMNLVIGVISLYTDEGGITIPDIRHILINDHKETTALSMQTVRRVCESLVHAKVVERSSRRVQNRFHTAGGHAFTYAMYKEQEPDDRKILFVIRQFPFTIPFTDNKPPSRILYDKDCPVIGLHLGGKYVGVDRIPTVLQPKQYYESKGWKVYEL